MENMNKLIESLNLDNHLSVDDIPDLDLYMDQVIQLFERSFESSKRNEDEKVLTKTMINNYAKGKLFFPINNKKYSKNHILLISMIYQMKGALSINDIKKSLDELNNKISVDEFDIENFYESYLHITKNNVERFTENTIECVNEVKREVAELEDEDSTYLENLLLLASLVNMSNFYRRAAEKIVDEIGDGKEAT